VNPETLWRQLSAALAMLENAIKACPEELWRRPSNQMGFWYMAYHTLFILDWDLSVAGAKFVVPAFDVHKYEWNRQEPPYEHPYSQEDVGSYLNVCRDRMRTLVTALRAGDRSLNGCHRIRTDADELVVYHIRHVQHHAAQLNLLLRQNVNDAPRWVRRGD
jgi:hypothetical protein